jgi:hypothetical protein
VNYVGLAHQLEQLKKTGTPDDPKWQCPVIIASRRGFRNYRDMKFSIAV